MQCLGRVFTIDYGFWPNFQPNTIDYGFGVIFIAIGILA